MHDKHRKEFTDEVANIAFDSIQNLANSPKLEYETKGPFFEILAERNVSLLVSREYEHFVVTLGGDNGKPWQSHMALPHPSGMWVDGEELIISSTRTPHQIFYLKPLTEDGLAKDIIPEGITLPEGTTYVPYKSLFLPGTLYVHDVVKMRGELYATATGHNFLMKIEEDGSWQRSWWPSCVDAKKEDAFNQNYLQLNSIAINNSPEDSFYTAFSNETTGSKPWKEGYGPKGKGVVFSGKTRDVVLDGLTCPHSAKLRDGKLWLCNSGYGEVGVVENMESWATFNPVVSVKGFTRGLAFAGDLAAVGLSKVIDFYEPYAPGITPSESQCGIVLFNANTGEEVASLIWPEGYQIYDVQMMPDVSKPQFPNEKNADGINEVLRFLS